MPAAIAQVEGGGGRVRIQVGVQHQVRDARGEQTDQRSVEHRVSGGRRPLRAGEA
jgi:hypothetical protein